MLSSFFTISDAGIVLKLRGAFTEEGWWVSLKFAHEKNVDIRIWTICDMNYVLCFPTFLNSLFIGENPSIFDIMHI